jgi:hypothetical protein
MTDDPDSTAAEEAVGEDVAAVAPPRDPHGREAALLMPLRWSGVSIAVQTFFLLLFHAGKAVPTEAVTLYAVTYDRIVAGPEFDPERWPGQVLSLLAIVPVFLLASWAGRLADADVLRGARRGLMIVSIVLVITMIWCMLFPWDVLTRFNSPLIAAAHSLNGYALLMGRLSAGCAAVVLLAASPILRMTQAARP